MAYFGGHETESRGVHLPEWGLETPGSDNSTGVFIGHWSFSISHFPFEEGSLDLGPWFGTVATHDLGLEREDPSSNGK